MEANLGEGIPPCQCAYVDECMFPWLWICTGMKMVVSSRSFFPPPLLPLLLHPPRIS